MASGLEFRALLDLLGHGPGDFTSVCHKPRGGSFRSTVVPSSDAPAVVHLHEGDVWFSVNPLSDPITWPEDRKGRGTAAEVTRLAALFCDLDIKVGGLLNMHAANEVIDTLSTMLNTRPSAVVFSGHGLQPFWVVEDGPAGADARALLRRWGRLVAHVAEKHGGKVDMVYDVARVLRVPNTMNFKTQPFMPVVGYTDTGYPLSVGEIHERLIEYGVVEIAEDRKEPGQVVSAPADWQWAERTCNYAAAMVNGWASDNPSGRHPWLVQQATRIAAGSRYGCWDAAGHTAAVHALALRFRTLLNYGEVRCESPGEISDALAWGIEVAASKSAVELATEVGAHSHEGAEGLTFDSPAEGSVPGVEAEPNEDPYAAVRRTFITLDWDSLWEDESGEDWILEPLIAARRGIALYSPPKVGKSLLALEIVVGISKGIRTLGTMPDRAHRILYVDHENDPVGDVRTRLEDMDYKPDDLRNLFYLSYPVMAPLDSQQGAQQIVAIAQAYDCDIVVIDTISRAVAGEENENDTWLRLYRNTGLALKQAGIAAIRLDHTGKDQEKGMRGGSAKYGDLDAVWKLTKEAEDTYKLTCTDRRMLITETELVITRKRDPLRHKVEGSGWRVAADRKLNELIETLARLGVAQSAGKPAARDALKAAGLRASNSVLESALKHRKNCPKWARAGVDHTTCPILEWAVPGSEVENAL